MKNKLPWFKHAELPFSMNCKILIILYIVQKNNYCFYNEHWANCFMILIMICGNFKDISVKALSNLISLQH